MYCVIRKKIILARLLRLLELHAIYYSFFLAALAEVWFAHASVLLLCDPITTQQYD
jgi:hypothetical protein